MVEMFPEDVHRVWRVVHHLTKQWGIEHLENLLEENGLPAFRATEEWVARTLLVQAWSNEYRRTFEDGLCFDTGRLGFALVVIVWAFALVMIVWAFALVVIVWTLRRAKIGKDCYG
ncbi:hypothetical protein [Absidia glauca]|uniref:Uncharacterized protein n=1 Tax=Absidia glauca TaxID=4829 RepID=A0A168L4T8_ABSGL|nr:hypothetical protein [Absidia glauca]